MLDGERGPRRPAGDVDPRPDGRGLRRRRADGHLAGAHRQHDLSGRRDARIRRAPRLARREGRRAVEPQRERRRRVRLEELGRARRVGREGRAPDARVRTDGHRADLDLRAVSDEDAAGLRPADRLGRVERDLVRQLRHRRAHRALSRPARHLLRHHRPRAGRRPAPDGKSRRPAADAARRRARGRCSRTISSSPCSGSSSASSPGIASPSSTASSSRRRRIT